jgi:hypothetical protein
MMIKDMGIIFSRPNGILRFIFGLPVWLYRMMPGWLLSNRFLVSSHTSRKTGKQRQVVVEAFTSKQSAEIYSIPTGWRKKPDWFLNILLKPLVEVIVGSNNQKSNATVLPTEKYWGYSHKRPLAFEEFTCLMMDTSFSSPHDDCLLLANSVPMIQLSPQQMDNP